MQALPAKNPPSSTFWTAFAIAGAIEVVRAIATKGLSLPGDGLNAAILGGATWGGGALAQSEGAKEVGKGVLAAGAGAAIVGYGTIFLGMALNPGSTM